MGRVPSRAEARGVSLLAGVSWQGGRLIVPGGQKWQEHHERREPLRFGNT